MFSSSNTIRSSIELRARLEQMGRRERGPMGSDRERALRSGHEELDALLPGGGWPLGALTELLSDTPGIGELELLLPALRALARTGRCLAWIAPPYVPYAPALVQQGLPLEHIQWIRTERPQEALWAAEQALRCPAVGAVLGWSTHIVDRSLRRLQLAAETGHSFGILHRPAAAAQQPSPAALRLRLEPMSDGLVVEVKKSRGGRAGMRLRLPRIAVPFSSAPSPGMRTAPQPAAETFDALAVHSSTGAAA